MGNAVKEHKTEPLYRKVGRRYVPIHSHWTDSGDQMQVGTFRMVYAYRDGARRYEYDVTPATAPTVAALMIARQAIEDEIRKRAQMRPQSPHKYTQEQQALIDKFREDMGGMMPTWWTESTAYEISEAAIKAVLEFNP